MRWVKRYEISGSQLNKLKTPLTTCYAVKINPASFPGECALARKMKMPPAPGTRLSSNQVVQFQS